MDKQMVLEISSDAAGVDLEAESMRQFGVPSEALTDEQRVKLREHWPQLTLRQIIYACARRQGVELGEVSGG